MQNWWSNVIENVSNVIENGVQWLIRHFYVRDEINEYCFARRFQNEGVGCNDQFE